MTRNGSQWARTTRSAGLVLSLTLISASVSRAASDGAAASAPASQPASAPASQPVGVLILEGQVVDHLGAGVKDVEARIFRVVDERRDELGVTTSDAMGDFKLYGPRAIHGRLVVALRKPGFKPHEIEVESLPDELAPFVDYQLGGALTLSGTVRDALTDRPIVGAKVALRTYAGETPATTGESGQFELQELLPGKVQLIVEAEGFARHQQSIDVAEGAEALTVRLDPERIVHLRVADDADLPISQAIVESLVVESADYRTLPTDADGRVTIRGLAMTAPKLEVRLSHPRFVSSQSFDRVIELPRDAAESTHTLRMAPAAFVSGTVTSVLEKRPLGGARLTVGKSLNEAVATAYSDFDGSFTLTGVPPGENVITVHLAEHAPRLFNVSVAAHERTSLDVVLSPAAAVTGRVLDPDGQPVAGAHVLASRWQGHETLGLQAMTDAEGRFTIVDAPVEPFEVDVLAVGFQPLKGRTVGPGSPHEFRFTETRSAPGSDRAAQPRDGEAAPAFDVTTLTGRRIRRDDLKGKHVLLDFWATWCGPCVREVPHLLAVHKEFGARTDFEIIGISLDMDEKGLKKFLQDRKIAWAQVFGDDAGATRTAEQFGVVGIPMTFLMGPDGRVIASRLGGAGMTEEIRKRLNPAAGN